MKFLQIVLLVCVAVCYIEAAEIDLEKLEAISKECQDENKASDDDLKHVLKIEPSNTQEQKCLRACLLHKMEILDDNNHLNKENALKVVHTFAHDDEVKKNLGEAAVEACKDIEISADRCEAAETYVTCMIGVVKGKDAPSLADILATPVVESK